MFCDFLVKEKYAENIHIKGVTCSFICSDVSQMCQAPHDVSFFFTCIGRQPKETKINEKKPASTAVPIKEILVEGNFPAGRPIQF